MPDGETPKAGEEGQTPESQQQQTPPAGEKPKDTWEDGTPVDAEKARKTLEKLRESEAREKELKRKADELDAKVKEFERAQLSETERVTAENKDLAAKLEAVETRLKEQTIREQITEEARNLGFIDVEDAVVMVDRSKLQIDDDNKVKNLKPVLDELLKLKPHLKGDTGGTPHGPAPTPPRQQAPNDAQVAERVREEMRSTGRYSL